MKLARKIGFFIIFVLLEFSTSCSSEVSVDARSKAELADPNGSSSSIGTVATPTHSVVAGTYTSPQSLTLASATADSTIYFTVDGSPPTTSSTVYGGAITVSSSQTVKALAVKLPWADSAVASAAYVITGTVAPPTFSVAGGTYPTSQSVTLASSTAGSTIYYTVDGSPPTTSSTLYGGAITVSTSQTVKALAVKSTWADSEVESAAYVIAGTVATPTFSVAAGTYTSSQSLSLVSSTAGSTIYYTVDGSAPNTSSNLYNGAITVSASQT